MPRRMIDADIRKSGSLSRVSIPAGHTFILLMTLADDQGRADGCVLGLRSELFPRRRDVSDDDVTLWLEELCAEGCLHAYIEDGEMYLHFPEWEEYQHLRTPSKERRPAPEGLCVACDPSGKEKEKELELEAGGDSRSLRLISATFGKKPKKTAKPKKTTRRARRAKQEVPDSLPPADMERLRLYAEEKFPTLAPRLKDLVEACLVHHRKTGNKAGVVDFYAACQQWFANEMKFSGGNRGKTGKSNYSSGGRTLTDIALDPRIE